MRLFMSEAARDRASGASSSTTADERISMTTRARMNTSVAFVGIAALGLTSATLVQYLSKRAVVRRKAIGRKLRVSGHTVQLVDQGTGPCVVARKRQHAGRSFVEWSHRSAG